MPKQEQRVQTTGQPNNTTMMLQTGEKQTCLSGAPGSPDAVGQSILPAPSASTSGSAITPVAGPLPGLATIANYTPAPPGAALPQVVGSPPVSSPSPVSVVPQNPTMMMGGTGMMNPMAPGGVLPLMGGMPNLMGQTAAGAGVANQQGGGRAGAGLDLAAAAQFKAQLAAQQQVALLAATGAVAVPRLQGGDTGGAGYRDYSRIPLDNDQAPSGKNQQSGASQNGQSGADQGAECGTGSGNSGGANASGKEPSFPVKLHRILSNEEFKDVISWLPHGRSWRVLKPKAFEEKVIPLYFRHAKYASFMRQVNGWGFKRMTQGPDHNSYYHELFLRGLPHLCLKMRRPARSKQGNVDSDANPDFYRLSMVAPLPPGPGGSSSDPSPKNTAVPPAPSMMSNIIASGNPATAVTAPMGAMGGILSMAGAGPGGAFGFVPPFGLHAPGTAGLPGFAPGLTGAPSTVGFNQSSLSATNILQQNINGQLQQNKLEKQQPSAAPKPPPTSNDSDVSNVVKNEDTKHTNDASDAGSPGVPENSTESVRLKIRERSELVRQLKEAADGVNGAGGNIAATAPVAQPSSPNRPLPSESDGSKKEDVTKKDELMQGNAPIGGGCLPTNLANPGMVGGGLPPFFGTNLSAINGQPAVQEQLEQKLSDQQKFQASGAGGVSMTQPTTIPCLTPSAQIAMFASGALSGPGTTPAQGTPNFGNLNIMASAMQQSQALLAQMKAMQQQQSQQPPDSQAPVTVLKESEV